MKISPSAIGVWAAMAVLTAATTSNVVAAEETNKQNIRGKTDSNRDLEKKDFKGPDWAKKEGKEDDEMERRVIIEYVPNNKSNMLQDLEDADNEDEAEMSNLAWAITADEGTDEESKKGKFKIKYEFDDLNVVVVTGKQRKFKKLVDAHGMNMLLMEDDQIREVYTPMENYVDTSDTMDDHRHNRRELQTLSYNDIYNHNGSNQMLPFGVQMVEATNVWNEGYSGAGAKVCVVDSGTYAASPDFITANIAGDNTPNGSSLAEGGVWSVDGCKHGTHCAGTIAAEDDNIGVVGVAPDTNIHTIKVFHGTSCSWTYASGLIAATQKCKDRGANVISMSLGGGGSSTTESNHFQSLFNSGILTVAAAGNGGNSAFSYPASYPSIMSVAAVDKNSNRVSFSQYNSQVDIAAPGSSVWSVRSGDSTGNNPLNYSGTSMATPHVAGVAALLYGAFKSYPIYTSNPLTFVQRIREALEGSALDRGSSGRDNYYGYGIVKAKAALDCLKGLTNKCTAMPGTAPIPAPVPAPVPTPTAPVPTPTAPVPTPTAPVPTPTAPVPTPTNGGCVNGVHKLRFDGWASETSWSVKESSSGVQIAQGSGGSNNSLVSYPLTCMNNNLYYHYTIKDTWGDGICCSEGNGYYQIHSNNALVKSGGAFQYVEEVLFKPTVSSAGNVDFSFEYMADYWPEELAWKITTDLDGVAGERPYDTYSNYGKKNFVHASVGLDRCVKLNVWDSWGDGFYSGGYMKIFYGGNLYFDIGSGRPTGNFSTAFTVTICGPNAVNTFADEDENVEEGSTILTENGATLIIAPEVENDNKGKTKKIPQDNGKDKDKKEKKNKKQG